MSSDNAKHTKSETLESEATVLGLVASFLGQSSDEPTPSDLAPQCQPAAAEQSSNDNVDDRKDQTAANTVINVIIFSKDRPWQLQQLLKSFELCDDQDLDVRIFVIARVQDLYRQGYEQVCHESDSYITFLEEIPSNSSSFQDLLLGVANDEERPAHYWMFLTDDCLLLIPLLDLLQTACQVLNEHSEAAYFLSRLHAGITWCQTRDKPCLPPSKFMRYSAAGPAYVYPLDRGVLDWKYPWDLSGGIYRDGLVQNLFHMLRETDGLSHPNVLEMAGNKILASNKLSSVARHDCAVPIRPVLRILAINRVQDVCQAPLACEGPSISPESLLQLQKEGRNLDMHHYKTAHYNSSHIGDLVLSDGDRPVDKEQSAAATTPALSVLIPVHTGRPEAAYHTMISVAMQAIDVCKNDDESNPLSPLQVVIIDDRCTDGSINAMLDAANNLKRQHAHATLTIHDHRKKGRIATCIQGAEGEKPSVCIIVELYDSPSPGVAAALNHGLAHCRADLVARMDADDVCAGGRFVQQMQLLQARPNLKVVGTNAIIFREQAGTMDDRTSSIVSIKGLPYSSEIAKEANQAFVKTEVSIQPSDPGFAAWAMLFSCCICHPSVMYRKDVIQELGGYNEKCQCAEDYVLWLRLTSSDCGALASIPIIGVWHRKHGNRPTSRKSRQSDEALAAATKRIAGLVGEEKGGAEFARTVSVLRKPDEASDSTKLNQAAELLTRLERAFLELNSESLSTREIRLVQEDCNARLGELATLVCARFGDSESSIVNDSDAWRLWCERCPHQSFERIALLANIRAKVDL